MSDDLTIGGEQLGQQLQVLRLAGLLEVSTPSAPGGRLDEVVERARSMAAHPSGRLPVLELGPAEAAQLRALFDAAAAAVEQVVEQWRLVALQVFRALEHAGEQLAPPAPPEVRNATRHLRLVGPGEQLDPRAAALRARAARGTGPAVPPPGARRRR